MSPSSDQLSFLKKNLLIGDQLRNANCEAFPHVNPDTCDSHPWPHHPHHSAIQRPRYFTRQWSTRTTRPSFSSFASLHLCQTKGRRLSVFVSQEEGGEEMTHTEGQTEHFSFEDTFALWIFIVLHQLTQNVIVASWWGRDTSWRIEYDPTQEL